MDRINVELGRFPFPLIEGPDESRYLTWVRNHSNYLAERGFLDYMRIVAILVRGILVNLLTILPLLLILSLLLGLFYNQMLDNWKAQLEAGRHQSEETAQIAPGPEQAPEAAGGERPDWVHLTRGLVPTNTSETQAQQYHLNPPIRPVLEKPTVWRRIGSWVWAAQDRLGTKGPYYLTPWVAALALFYYLLFPIVTRLFKVASHKKSLETGSGSSVRLRDSYERSFGGLLIAVLGMAVLETIPLLLHLFHAAREDPWRGVVASIAGGSSVVALSSAGKLLSIFGDKASLIKRKLVMALIGLVGLLLPLLIVLYASEFIVYKGDGFEVPWAKLHIVPALLALGVLVAFFLGLKKGPSKTLFKLLTLLAIPLALVAVLHFLRVGDHGIGPAWLFLIAIAIEVWVFSWLSVDINQTSVHGLYRDRLASAYLVGRNTHGDVDIEEDIDLQDICLYEAFSTAPYHLINVAHNLQHSKDISIRERDSDFFVFSKRFTGGARTGYCLSENLEKVFPQMDLATAMAISAAAAAPNMGKGTSRAMVALLTLLNVRLGYWIPNPGRLEAAQAKRTLGLSGERRDEALRAWSLTALGSEKPAPEIAERLQKIVDAQKQKVRARLRNKNLGLSFPEVFSRELLDIRRRWENTYEDISVRRPHPSPGPTPDHGLVGLGLSGGGIRSATLNLGILQALDRAGVFDHVDYLSTVSGGGYLGSSISTLMRTRERLHSEVTGRAETTVDEDFRQIHVESNSGQKHHTYRFHPDAEITDAVESGEVALGTPLIRPRLERGGLWDRFLWRVQPRKFIAEMFSLLDEKAKWVNLSDGGHIENLATIELLRRRCRFIITGDGEADPRLYFGSLATLIRYARIDLGIQIDIDPAAIRLRDPVNDRRSRDHFALGTIRYPKTGKGGGYEPTTGYLLYLKSSFSGDEEEIIQQYRADNPEFPHESTADQFFDEGQFEAYRALGQHIGERALEYAPGGKKGAEFSDWNNWYVQGKGVADYFERWFADLGGNKPEETVAGDAATA